MLFLPKFRFRVSSNENILNEFSFSPREIHAVKFRVGFRSDIIKSIKIRLHYTIFLDTFIIYKTRICINLFLSLNVYKGKYYIIPKLVI